jgi:hypothetical protein
MRKRCAYAHVPAGKGVGADRPAPMARESCTPGETTKWCPHQILLQVNFMNAFAERFVREARETLDRMILFGHRHLMHVLKKVECYHNFQRPHQGINNKIPCGYGPPENPALPNEVRCEEVLGGLLKHYYSDRKAA